MGRSMRLWVTVKSKCNWLFGVVKYELFKAHPLVSVKVATFNKSKLIKLNIVQKNSRK